MHGVSGNAAKTEKRKHLGIVARSMFCIHGRCYCHMLETHKPELVSCAVSDCEL